MTALFQVRPGSPHGYSMDCRQRYLEVGSNISLSIMPRKSNAYCYDVIFGQLGERAGRPARDTLGVNRERRSALFGHVDLIGRNGSEPEMAAPLVCHAGDLVDSTLVIPNTMTNVAGMTHDHTCRDGTGSHFPCCPVSLYGSAVTSSAANLSITIRRDDTLPKPATLRLVDLQPEAISKRSTALPIGDMTTRATAEARAISPGRLYKESRGACLADACNTTLAHGTVRVHRENSLETRGAMLRAVSAAPGHNFTMIPSGVD